MIRRLLATTGCAAAAVAFVALPSAAHAPATVGATLAAHSQVLQVGPPPHKCPPNFTQGTIGGVPKCLAAGQQCQQAHAADYTKYGFRCTLVGRRYQLTKTGAQHTGLTPHPTGPVKPKPTPPAHHY